MNVVLTLLAVLGVLALVYRAAASLLRLLGTSVDRLFAREAATVRANRGDLTGMAEASAWQARTGRRRRRALAVFLAWVVLLVVPPLSPWGRAVYAACSALWLLHIVPLRRA